MLPLGVGTLVFLVVYWTALPAGWRRVAFNGAALAALAAYFPIAVTALGLLTLAVHVALGAGDARPTWKRALGVTFVCCGLLLLRGSPALPPPVLVGLSYAVFRLIHVAIERARGKLAAPGPWALVEYALFPPAFLSGPIERYPDFVRGIDVASLDLDGALWGTRRVLFGLAKKVLVVGPLLAEAQAGFADPSGGAGSAWTAILCYSLYLYLDFSAYCDIAVGVARLFGYRLSENFRWPYLAEDIGEFWRRWHITLSFWLRDYVYLPLSVKLAASPRLRRRPLLVGSLSAVATMLACGLWHGNTLAFAAWGLGHGALLTTHQAYRQNVIGRLSVRRRRALLAHPLYRIASAGLTFAAVTILWTFFRFPYPDALRMLRRLAAIG